jgi:hypothetical protein
MTHCEPGRSRWVPMRHRTGSEFMSSATTRLSGRSLIGFREGTSTGDPLYARDPATGQQLQPGFIRATAEEVDRAVKLAADRDQILEIAHSLEGHRTATVHGTEQDLRDFADLIAILGSQWLPNGRGSCACHGPRRSVSFDIGRMLDLGRKSGDFPLHAPGLLSGISRQRSAGRTQRSQSSWNLASDRWQHVQIANGTRLETAE